MCMFWKSPQSYVVTSDIGKSTFGSNGGVAHMVCKQCDLSEIICGSKAGNLYVQSETNLLGIERVHIWVRDSA